jgi:hypothetical protein
VRGRVDRKDCVRGRVDRKDCVRGRVDRKDCVRGRVDRNDGARGPVDRKNYVNDIELATFRPVSNPPISTDGVTTGIGVQLSDVRKM